MCAAGQLAGRVTNILEVAASQISETSLESLDCRTSRLCRLGEHCVASQYLGPMSRKGGKSEPPNSHRRPLHARGGISKWAGLSASTGHTRVILFSSGAWSEMRRTIETTLATRWLTSLSVMSQKSTLAVTAVVGAKIADVCLITFLAYSNDLRYINSYPPPYPCHRPLPQPFSAPPPVYSIASITSDAHKNHHCFFSCRLCPFCSTRKYPRCDLLVPMRSFHKPD